MAKKKGWGDAFKWAKEQLSGVNINDPNQISSLLTKEGWQNGMTDKLKKWGTPLLAGAKAAKFMGIDPLGKMGIDVSKLNPDEIVNTVENITSNKPKNQPQYASYDRRNSPIYDTHYQSKSKNLPD